MRPCPLATFAQTQTKTLFHTIREGGNGGSLGSQVSVRSAKSSTTLLLVTDDGVTGHGPEELEEAADNLEAVLDDPEAEAAEDGDEGGEEGEEEEEEEDAGDEGEEEEDGREDDDA